MYNVIGNTGAQDLARALQANRVRLHASRFEHVFIRVYDQTIQQLDVSSNKIGDDGAQFLADALQDTAVNRISLACVDRFLDFRQVPIALRLFANPISPTRKRTIKNQLANNPHIDLTLL